MKGFKNCPYCEKLNPADDTFCTWCNSRLPTRRTRIVDAVLVVAAILAMAALVWRWSI